VVDDPGHGHHHGDSHTDWRDIRTRHTATTLAPAVRDHAVGILAVLAEAERRVHGVPANDVTFHGVGASSAIHRHMFEVADRHGFHFDTVQMPLNVMDARFDSSERGVLPIAAAHGTGVIGMKAFGDPFILDSNVGSPLEMLHSPMSLPISLQVTSIDSLAILQQALIAVRSFVPPAGEQRAELLTRTVAIAKDGRTERYKVSTQFDSTTQNPQWLG